MPTRGRPFPAKEGAPFSDHVKVRLHADETAQIDARLGEGESRSDYVRTAIREKLAREEAMRNAPEGPAPDDDGYPVERGIPHPVDYAKLREYNREQSIYATLPVDSRENDNV